MPDGCTFCCTPIAPADVRLTVRSKTYNTTLVPAGIEPWRPARKEWSKTSAPRSIRPFTNSPHCGGALRFRRRRDGAAPPRLPRPWSNMRAVCVCWSAYCSTRRRFVSWTRRPNGGGVGLPLSLWRKTSPGSQCNLRLPVFPARLGAGVVGARPLFLRAVGSSGPRRDAATPASLRDLSAGA